MNAADVDQQPARTSDVWTIVVAGGSGLRFGSRKQFVELHGRSVLQRSIDTAAGCSSGVVVVVPQDAIDCTGIESSDGVELRIVAGGDTRAASVRAGLAEVPATTGVVLVHDAARPLASAAVFERVIDAVRAGADAAVPVTPLADSIRTRSGDPVDRADLVAVQTPQGFPVGALRRAHADGADATDDATLVQATGGTVAMVDGELWNRKITDPSDLAAIEAVLEWRASQ
ncbi:MAG: 2-C-methyl-D-erythritol 4-phosphate cytidylyltransferase [Acidimicrobiales bacterium]